ncbi:MAG: hypothetical protein GXP21_05165 [Gammaproteobacteria bacterium]|nr:hypothetical protein [Gammaproteobacteria bacterium]
MAEKKIWVYLLAYNLIRLIMVESALLCDITPRRLSFKHTIQLWRTYRQQMGGKNDNVEITTEFLLLVGQLRLGNRVRKAEPRVLKKRPKTYPMMIRPRSVLKQEISQSWC